MTLSDQDKHRIVRFLLDNLDETERTEIEARFLTDDHYFQEVEALEEQLIRDYLQKRLSDKAASLFIRKYRSTQALRERVEQTRRVLEMAEPAAQRVRPGARAWLSAPVSRAFSLASVGAVVAGVLLVVVWPFKHETVQTPASFVLVSGSQRGAGAEQQRLEVRRNVPVELHVELLSHQDATSYRVIVTTPEGLQQWGSVVPAASMSSGGLLTIHLPAGILRPGDYIFSVQAPGKVEFETIEEYPLTVQYADR